MTDKRQARRDHMKAVLTAYEGDRRLAAHAVGMKYRSFNQYLYANGIDVPRTIKFEVVCLNCGEVGEYPDRRRKKYCSTNCAEKYRQSLDKKRTSEEKCSNSSSI